MNIPNILTIIRLALIPIFGFYLYEKQYLVAALLFLLSGFTDILDGYIARRYNLITEWGKFVDPLADKLMQVTALALLTLQGFIPVLVLVLVVLKEVLMGAGSLLIYKKSRMIVSANWYGKMATVIFFIAVMMIIIFKLKGIVSPYSDIFVDVFIGIAVLATLFAFFMYLLAFRQIRKDAG